MASTLGQAKYIYDCPHTGSQVYKESLSRLKRRTVLSFFGSLRQHMLAEENLRRVVLSRFLLIAAGSVGVLSSLLRRAFFEYKDPATDSTED